jgi:hypothetical protein
MAGGGAAMAAGRAIGGRAMTRTHRRLHRLVWLLLALGVGVALLLAVLWRDPAHAAVLVSALGLGP